MMVLMLMVTLEDLQPITLLQITPSPDAGNSGIEISFLHNSSITDNAMQSNTRGLYMERSTNNTITGNTIRPGTVAGFEIPKIATGYIPVDVGTASSVNNGDTLTDFGNYFIQGDDEYFLYDLPATFDLPRTRY
jgi:parallel beta-helix repeat protein